MRRGGNSNRFKGVSMKYNVIYDISTEQYAPTILGIHTPTGSTPYRLMMPLFDAYKRYKYIGCDITIVNGSRIINPSSAYTTQAGMQTADPRDNLDPIMFKGCHGQDMGTILNTIYGNTGNVFTKSDVDKKALSEYLTNFYYQSLADPSWKKGNINSTLRIPGLHPLCYSVSSNMPFNPSFSQNQNGAVPPQIVDTWTGNGNSQTRPGIGNLTGTFNGAGELNGIKGYVVNPENITTNLGTGNTTFPMQLFTTKLHRLGWMDTKCPVMSSQNESASDSSPFNHEVNMLGKYFMGVLMLPSAKKSYNYLRMIVTHKFAFSGLRTLSEGLVWDYSTLGNLEDAVASDTYNNYMANVENPVKPSVQSLMLERDDYDTGTYESVGELERDPTE